MRISSPSVLREGEKKKEKRESRPERSRTTPRLPRDLNRSAREIDLRVIPTTKLSSHGIYFYGCTRARSHVVRHRDKDAIHVPDKLKTLILKIYRKDDKEEKRKLTKFRLDKRYEKEKKKIVQRTTEKIERDSDGLFFFFFFFEADTSL